MMTVSEVSKVTGVSIRTLQYYDRIGLLKPAEHTKAGYRMYDRTSLERLQLILLYKELEFPLNEIKRVIESPDYDRETALSQQIEMLTIKRNHIENLIAFAKAVKDGGEREMDFRPFDKKKKEEYSMKAKEQWGKTEEYKEWEKKREKMTEEEEDNITQEFMKLFAEFGKMKTLDPSSEITQLQVRKLQDFISEHYYKCSKEILRGLGQMYAAGGEFTENIDKAGGNGTAAFVGKAIEKYCQ